METGSERVEFLVFGWLVQGNQLGKCQKAKVIVLTRSGFTSCHAVNVLSGAPCSGPVRESELSPITLPEGGPAVSHATGLSLVCGSYFLL